MACQSAGVTTNDRTLGGRSASSCHGISVYVPCKLDLTSVMPKQYPEHSPADQRNETDSSSTESDPGVADPVLPPPDSQAARDNVTRTKDPSTMDPIRPIGSISPLPSKWRAAKECA